MPTEEPGCAPKRPWKEIRAPFFKDVPSYEGTGDIEAPDPPSIDPEGERLRLRPMFPQETWEQIDERAHKASREKREWLAQQLAEGNLRTPTQIQKAAQHLGCLPREVQRQRMTPSMARMVKERMHNIAQQYTAEALPSQAEKAKEDVQSFRAVAQIGGFLQPAAVNVQTNVAVDARNGGDDMSDAKWFENFRQRAGRNRRLIEAVTVEPADPAT